MQLDITLDVTLEVRIFVTNSMPFYGRQCRYNICTGAMLKTLDVTSILLDVTSIQLGVMSIQLGVMSTHLYDTVIHLDVTLEIVNFVLFHTPTYTLLCPRL